MNYPIHLMTQLELHNELEVMLRADTAATGARWSSVDIYSGINHAIRDWGDKVIFPVAYTITDGWSTSAKEYTLPYYVHGDIDPQFYDGDRWRSFAGSHEVMEDADGTRKLRFSFFPPAEDGRIIYYVSNGVVPTTAVLMSGSMTTSSTSTTYTDTANQNVGESGFFKIGGEYMQYSGRVVGPSTSSTLSNLLRGRFGTTAATHAALDPLYFCVAAHRTDLFEVLKMKAAVYLNGMFINRAPSNEIGKYQWNMRYYQSEYDKFWRRYIVPKSPRMRVDMAGVNDSYAGYPGMFNNWRRQTYYP